MNVPSENPRCMIFISEGLKVTKAYETVTKKERILKNVSNSGLDCWMLGIH